jgi:predicted ribosome quality control (RQC) complex YloA/Tae2 family protein
MKTRDIFIAPIKKTITFLLGESAHDNEAVIDLAKEDDIWFHIGEGKSSAHIVALLPSDIDRKEKKYIIKQGAVLCKQVSKYKSEKQVPIIYAKIKDIEKTSVPGTVIIKEGQTGLLSI